MTVSLVGQCGSGKSTVISLIEILYDSQSDKVLIDGIDLREFQLKWIRSKISLVSQEPILFTGSIKDNISYGKDSATVEEIRAAAELANASDFIDKLPEGLDTAVGEHGIKLSGGHKQRAAIARAILKDPRILLLDEATSALDAESERVVNEALDKIVVNRITVVVAHRLSTICNVNVIAVLHQGNIVEQGTHLKLLEDPHGVYSNLIHSQEVDKDEEQCIENIHEQEITVESRRERLASWGAPDVIKNTLVAHGFSEDALVNKNVTSPETSKQPPEVLISRLAYLDKPDLPVLIGGVIFAIITGGLMPTFGLLLSRVIKNFFESSHKLQKDGNFEVFMFIVLGGISLIVFPSRALLGTS